MALNVTGDVVSLDRASTLTTPGAFRWTEVVDVRIGGDAAALPSEPMMHIGAVALTVRCRPLDADLVRLTLQRPLPLRVGDRAVLRDPGDRRVWGVRVLDPLPPPLRRRGAASERAKALQALTGEPELDAEVDRRELVDDATLRQLGVPDSGTAGSFVRIGPWLMSAGRAERVAELAVREVTEHARARPLDPGLPLAVLADRLGLPSGELVAKVLPTSLRVVDGRVVDRGREVLPVEVEQALDVLTADLDEHPFAAPTSDRLRELGLDATRVAAASKAGRLLRLAPGVVLLPGADEQAVRLLGELAQPFTTSEARAQLGTSRRVVLPLLEHLDRARRTRRLPDDRRTVVRASPGNGAGLSSG